MPDTPIRVTKLGPGTLRVGATGETVDLEGHLSEGEFATDKEQDDPTPVLSGREVASPASYSASISGTVLLDLADGQSIFYYSHTHKGEQVAVSYIPNAEVGTEIRGVITMDPLGIGGDIRGNASAEFEWAFTEFPDVVPGAGAGTLAAGKTAGKGSAPEPVGA